MPGRRCFFCFVMLVMTICLVLVNFEQNFLIRFESLEVTGGSDNLTEFITTSIENTDSLEATGFSDNLTEFIMKSIENTNNDTDNATETSDSCECQTETNRNVYPCQVSAISTSVIHCNSGGHGKFLIRSNTSSLSEHIGAFVRVNGPLIDTIFFTWSDSDLAWVARYNSCLHGSYSGAVYIYMQSFPDAEAVLRSEACLHQLFAAPFLFSWIERAPSA